MSLLLPQRASVSHACPRHARHRLDGATGGCTL